MLGDESMDIETFRRGDNTWFLFGPICALMILQCAETLESLTFYLRLFLELSCSHNLQSIWQSLGGCNVAPMVAVLDDPELAPLAVEALSKTILMFGEKFDVEEEMNAGNTFAKAGDGELGRDRVVHPRSPKVPEKYSLCVFKVTVETNTDGLSLAQDAWSQPDISLHALATLKNARDGFHGSQARIIELMKKGFLSTWFTSKPRVTEKYS